MDSRLLLLAAVLACSVSYTYAAAALAAATTGTSSVGSANLLEGGASGVAFNIFVKNTGTVVTHDIAAAANNFAISGMKCYQADGTTEVAGAVTATFTITTGSGSALAGAAELELIGTFSYTAITAANCAAIKSCKATVTSTTPPLSFDADTVTITACIAPAVLAVDASPVPAVKLSGSAITSLTMATQAITAEFTISNSGVAIAAVTGTNKNFAVAFACSAATGAAFTPTAATTVSLPAATEVSALAASGTLAVVATVNTGGFSATDCAAMTKCTATVSAGTGAANGFTAVTKDFTLTCGGFTSTASLVLMLVCALVALRH